MHVATQFHALQPVQDEQRALDAPQLAQGALHQLPNQLPESIGLQLPEIVVSEIVKHRMESVHQEHKLLQSATDKLQRLTSIWS